MQLMKVCEGCGLREDGPDRKEVRVIRWSRYDNDVCATVDVVHGHDVHVAAAARHAHHAAFRWIDQMCSYTSIHQDT